MIRINTDKVFALYCRTNRRVQWKYAEFGGMYRTIEEAIKSAKEHYGNTPFELLVEHIDKDIEVTERCGI